MTELTDTILRDMLERLRRRKANPIPEMLIMNRRVWMVFARSCIQASIPITYRRDMHGKRVRYVDNTPVHIFADMPDDRVLPLFAQPSPLGRRVEFEIHLFDEMPPIEFDHLFYGRFEIKRWGRGWRPD